MSADTMPIAPARFAAALKDLSVSMLHLKVLEIRNSIAHLQYSNDQLRPFAEGSASASTAPAATVSTPSSSPHHQNGTATGANASSSTFAEPDQDCIDAIKENEAVIDRMLERIALIKLEVEERGVSWTEFQSEEEIEARAAEVAATAAAAAESTPTNGVTGGHVGVNGDGGDEARRASPWTDGTFQTGTIRNGEVTMDEAPRSTRAEGGRLDDEQLRRAMEERMRELGGEDEDEDGGMHL